MHIYRLHPDLREYLLLKKEGIRNVKLERYDDALWYFFYATEMAWKKFFRFFCDEEIEEYIRMMGENYPGPRVLYSKGSNDKRIRLGHITSLLTDIGGHSRFIYNLMRNHSADKFVTYFYSTEMEDSSLAGKHMIREFIDTKIQMWFASRRDNLIDKGRKLYQQLINDNIDIAVIHMNPSDVSILYALSKNPRPLTIFFHQADFVFTLGSNYFDYHLDYRKIGFQHCQKLKPSENRYYFGAPSTAKDQIEKVVAIEKKSLGVPEDSILTATVANIYKILFMENESYFEMLETLLDANPHIYHILIGTGGDDTVIRLRGILNKKINTLKRVRYLGYRSDVLNVIKAIDIYLDSFPISGLLCSADAMALKKPVVSMVNNENPLYAIEDVVGIEECLAHSQSDYVHIVLRLANDDEYRKQIGERLYERYCKELSADAYINKFEKFCQDCHKERLGGNVKDSGRYPLLFPDFSDKSSSANYIKAPKGHNIRRSHFLDIAHKRYELGKRGMIRDCFLAIFSDWHSIYSILRAITKLFLLSILPKRLILVIKRFKRWLASYQRTAG